MEIVDERGHNEVEQDDDNWRQNCYVRDPPGCLYRSKKIEIKIK